MDPNETPNVAEYERVTVLALEIQQHIDDYYDGKLTPKEWLQLVVDAVQQEQEESHRAEVAAMSPVPLTGPVIAQCPRCNGNMRWADSVHNAIRCEACQYLMVSISAHNHVAKASEVQE